MMRKCHDHMYMVLGVSFDWGRRKGLDVFQEIAKRLDERYQVVLVGTDNNIDKQLSKNIISIHRTNSQRELAEIYSAADVFVNPTREDNYPTVNMESIACGTPVITFNTGGSPEMVDKTTGIIVPCDDIDQLVYSIEEVCKHSERYREECLSKSKHFNKWDKFEEYVNLYEEI